jgi:2',3'-cyclic-nucleotide 2'-phosphodiesterase/3'-nucleotidase
MNLLGKGTKRISVLAVLFFVSVLAFGQKIDLTVLATSDVHNNYLPYDYFSDMPTEQYGLVKLATAIEAQRQTKQNVLLVDNGDTLQGNPFGEYLAKNPPQRGQISPIMRLMNAMGYDAMTLGNHEFNYGLDYLNKVISGANFPVVSANIVKPHSEIPYFTPYVVLSKSLIDQDGKPQRVTIGITGFAPPQIVSWDGANLAGKVETRDIYDAAVKYVAEMKKAGADIIILLAHTGIVDFPRKGGEENAGYYLTQIPGVDAIVTGHAHMKFPGPAFAKISGVNLAEGTINGVPVVMPNSFADTLGEIDLSFEKTNGSWKRITGTSKLLAAYDTAKKTSLMATDQKLADLLAPEHQAVLKYIRAPIAAEGSDNAAVPVELTAPLTSFFALVRDDYSVQIINEAQTWYAKQKVQGTPNATLPILSAAAPFKAGGRQGPKYYTNIPAGPLASKNIADLYVYSNTIVLVKMTGAEIKEWLEMSAGQFNQIDPALKDEQNLINDKFPTYNFDVIDGVTYKIDVSVPSRYNEDGTLKTGGGQRIVDLQFQGKPIDPAQEFVVATNNYRSYGGGNFPNVNPSKIIFQSPDENRQVILKYLVAKKVVTPQSDQNWSLEIPQTQGPVVFFTSPLGEKLCPPGIKFLGTVDTGYGKYSIQ